MRKKSLKASEAVLSCVLISVVRAEKLDWHARNVSVRAACVLCQLDRGVCTKPPGSLTPGIKWLCILLLRSHKRGRVSYSKSSEFACFLLKLRGQYSSKKR